MPIIFAALDMYLLPLTDVCLLNDWRVSVSLQIKTCISDKMTGVYLFSQ